MLLAFSLAFACIAGGAFYWLYRASTAKAIDRLRQDLEDTLLGAAAGVEVEELLDIYQDAEPNDRGGSDDPRYQRQLTWLETVHRIEPRVWPYLYIVADHQPQARHIGNPPNPNIYTVFLVDLWINYDRNYAYDFLTPSVASEFTLRAYREGTVVHRDLYTDAATGDWMSAYTPLRNNQGEIVALLGVDFEADYVREVQTTIRHTFLMVAIVVYIAVSGVVYGLSGHLTTRLTRLRAAAQQIGSGNYDAILLASQTTSHPDDLDELAQTFHQMAQDIRQREDTIREISGREAETRHALDEERELGALKSRFVSMVSHELRTPLGVIRSSTEMLSDHGDRLSEPQRQTYFLRIQAAVSRMVHLLEDVLHLGKAEAGKLGCLPVPIQLHTFCQDVLEEVQCDLGGSHTIDLIHSEEENNVPLDPSLLRSILINLLSNAVKYSPSGGHITLSLSHEDAWVIFEVQDCGIGIPPEDQARLFELFHRAQNASLIQGTGLGLAIVKTCVDCHQGEIFLTSQVGVGSTFTVRLPSDLSISTASGDRADFS